MIDVDKALRDEHLLGAALGPANTWETWSGVLRAAFAESLGPRDLRRFTAVSGGRKPPSKRVQELWAICGRRSGKSRMAAAIATYIATFLDHKAKLAPGETGYVLCLSPTVGQAQLVFSYALAFLQRSPILSQKIENITASEIKLAGNIVIATHPNSYRSVRGRTLLACVFDESAFWRDEVSANPDLETYRAVLPSLATTEGMLVGISSPYRRSGLLYAKHRDFFGKNDPGILVVQGATETFNPVIDKKLIARSRASDPAAALSEWDAEFRSDLAAFLDDASIDAAIDTARALELPPVEGTSYVAFADASAGRHDHFCLGIGHKQDERFVADVVRGRRPPFNPEEVAAEFAILAKDYGCSTVVGDNYSGEWVAAAFRKAGVEYTRSRLPKSQLYLETLPYWMRGAVSIPNHERLLRELRLLERKTHAGGKDAVDHGQNGSDDYANVLCGAMHSAMAERLEPSISLCPPIFVRARPEPVDLTHDAEVRTFRDYAVR